MSRDTAAIRLIEGIELPAPGTWKLDPGHAEVGFIGKHFMLTKVRGRFTDVNGELTVGAVPNESRIVVEIAMASVNSGDQARDEHLRSEDFFEVEQYPTARFSSTDVSWLENSGIVIGELEIRDVSRPVELDVDYTGHVLDPWGNDRVVFSARGKLDREEWGLTWNMLLDGGGIVVSKEIEIEIQAEFVRES